LSKLYHLVPSPDRRPMSLCRALLPHSFLPFGQNTKSASSVFPQRQDVLVVACSRHDVKKRYRTPLPREHVQYIEVRLYQNRLHGKIAWEYEWRNKIVQYIYGLPSIRAVDANFVDLLRVITKVLDMAQNMATAVLTNKIA
jgi:hypothetical protein